MWPLALFYRVYPHTVTLLWLQDVAPLSAANSSWWRGHARPYDHEPDPVTTRPVAWARDRTCADNSLELVHDRL